MFNSFVAGLPAILAAKEAGSPGFIVGPIAKVMGTIYNMLFNLIYSITETGSLILAIILFTFLVKLVLMPLMYKQIKGTYRMQQLQPELNKIRAKYANKTDEESQRRMAFELQDFQKENGANMFAGCLPMLIQLPILYALFYIFNQPYEYVGVINDVYTNVTQSLLNVGAAERVEALKPIILAKNMTVDVSVFDQVFGLVKTMSLADWNSVLSTLGTHGTELSAFVMQKHSIEYFFGLSLVSHAGLSFPGILIPICSGITTYFSTWYMQKRQKVMNSGVEDEMTAGMTKSMNIVMPIMMGVITINTPVALGIYWTLSNIFSVGQTWLLYKILAHKDANGTLKFKKKENKQEEQPKSTIVDRNKFTNQKGAGNSGNSSKGR